MKLIVPKQNSGRRKFITHSINSISALLILFFTFVFAMHSAKAQTRIVPFNTPGTYTWTAPCGVTSIQIRAWAGGGGGGGAVYNSTQSLFVGGGGGGGGFAGRVNYTVVPNTTYTIVVGAGGNGGTNGTNYGNGNGNGGDGASTTFGTVLTATGGLGGRRNPNQQGDRGGYIAGAGIYGYLGGNGIAGNNAGYGGGGGGGSASPVTNGTTPSNATGGAGAVGGGGNGGNGQSGSNGNGDNGAAPGGGGGGARRSTLSGNHDGGNGGSGKLEIEYVGATSVYCNTTFGGVEPITLVNFAGINYSSSHLLTSPAYESPCGNEGDVIMGNTYTVRVRGNTDGNYRHRIRVFIDWNQNGVLNDAGEMTNEMVLENSTGIDGKEVSLAITVPSMPVAQVGKTRMRVIKSYYQYPFIFGSWLVGGQDPTNPCGSYSLGQTEDFILNVTGPCDQPDAATANGNSGTIIVCAGSQVILRQIGGTLSPGQYWEWSKGACGAGAEHPTFPGNPLVTSDAAYTFTASGPGTTSTYYIKARGGTCEPITTGNCKSVTVSVVGVGTISVNNPYTANFSVCKTAAAATRATFSIGGGATGASISTLPAGMTGSYLSGTFTIAGTPNAGVAVGSYPYTITLSGNSPCVNPTMTGTITVTDRPTLAYASGLNTYCIGGTITPNAPTTATTGGLPTTYSIPSGFPALPNGLILSATTGTISGSPTLPVSASATYTIRATNSCGTADATVQIAVIAGNTVFNVTPSGNQSICSNSTGVSIGLDNSVAGISYQLYRNGVSDGSPILSTGGPFNFTPLRTAAGTYTIAATTSCVTNMNGSLVLTVTPVPNATFSYGASTFCKSSTNPTPVMTGTAGAGGYFTAIPALTFANTATGEINLASTSQGNYQITYNVPASGGCTAYSYTSPVIIFIANAPNVYRVTGGGGYCAGGTGVPVGLDGSQISVSYQLYRDGNPVGSAFAGTGSPLTFGGPQTVAGTYTVQAILGTCIQNMDDEAGVIINPAPAAIAINPGSSTLCQGAILPLNATFHPSVTAAESKDVSSDDDQSIPDNNAGGTNYLLKIAGVPAGATITGVNLDYYISHPYVGDLIINLKGPNGNVLNIANRIGGSGDNFGSNNTNLTRVSSSAAIPITDGVAPYTAGPYLPQAAGGIGGATLVPSNISNVFTFSGLYGATSSSANGNWYLSVRDAGSSDVGTLRYAKLTVNYTTVGNPVSVTWSSITDLHTDPGATNLYVSNTPASTVYLKPASSGAKLYTATATNAFGCSTTATTSLTVNPSPNILVSANYCIPGVVRITATSSENVTMPGGWVWSNGTSGTVSGTGNRTSYIDVATAGTYYVSAKAATGACPGTGSMSIAQELVTNGNFESGNIGFTNTGYTYVADDPLVNTELLPQSTYGIGTDGQHYHNRFYGWDHTFGTGEGNFMLVNGRENSTVWENLNVTIKENTTYYFSAWGISLNNVSPFANLSFQVNGSTVASTGLLAGGSEVSSAANSGWTRFAGTWTSGPGQFTANIRIINTQSSPNGNDFGLDDISFGTLSAFFNVTSNPADTTQMGVCAGSAINDISYEIGGNGLAPTTTGTLPAGITAYWNGRTYRVGGTISASATPGTYVYNVTSTGCGAQTRKITINIVPPSNSGTFASSTVSACYNTGGNIAVTGSVGTQYTWQSSPDGTGLWTNIAGAPSTNTYTYPGLTNAAFYRVIVKNTAACEDVISPVVKVGLRNVWTGRTSNDWNLGTNWSDDNTPVMSPCNTVIIPNVAPGKPLPILSAVTATVDNIDIKAGATLTLFNDARLRIAGSIINANTNGGINANDGIIEINGTAGTQNISGSAFVGKNIKELVVSNNLNVMNVLPNDTINILRKLSFGNGTADLATNDNVTLKSTASTTASVGRLQVGNAITGKFVIERFINYWQNWNLISAPVRDGTLTVRNSWQEAGSPLTSNGYGTQITAPGGGNGLDASSASPNLKWWNAAPGMGWQNITNTNTQAINRPSGYYIYIRGDRGYGTSSPLSTGSVTTLRAKGTIYDASIAAPAVTVNATSANGYMIQVANPLASAVDFASVFAHSTGIKKSYQVWDPSRTGNYGAGQYQVITGTTGWLPTPAAGLYTISPYSAIQSGQAFFVEASTTGGSSINFVENDKIDSSRTVSRETPPEALAIMSTMLHVPSGDIADGNRVVYDASFNNTIGDEDFNKPVNSGENFGILTASRSLIVEGRRPITTTDTIHYNMTNLRTQAYRLSFEPRNLGSSMLEAELVDRFTNTRTSVSLSDSTYVNFTTTTDAASKASNRFILVFKRSALVVLPVNFVSVSARRQQDRSITVNWAIANEINIIRYEVERSANGSNFTGILTKDATRASSYTQTDLSPLSADNFYRIKAIGIGNDITYSAVVKVSALPVRSSIVISPNPVTGKQMNVVFTGYSKGEYQLQLTNVNGQVVYSGSVKVNSENFSRQIELQPLLAGGHYQLIISSSDGSTKTIPVLIQ